MERVLPFDGKKMYNQLVSSWLLGIIFKCFGWCPKGSILLFMNRRKSRKRRRKRIRKIFSLSLSTFCKKEKFLFSLVGFILCERFYVLLLPLLSSVILFHIFPIFHFPKCIFLRSFILFCVHIVLSFSRHLHSLSYYVQCYWLLNIWTWI